MKIWTYDKLCWWEVSMHLATHLQKQFMQEPHKSQLIQNKYKYFPWLSDNSMEKNIQLQIIGAIEIENKSTHRLKYFLQPITWSCAKLK